MFNPEKVNHLPLDNKAEEFEKSEKFKNAESAIDGTIEKIVNKFNEKV